jgi:hypothetical protein
MRVLIFVIPSLGLVELLPSSSLSQLQDPYESSKENPGFSSTRDLRSIVHSSFQAFGHSQM